MKSPVYSVRAVPIEKIRANAYNPNAVTPPEMKLLELFDLSRWIARRTRLPSLALPFCRASRRAAAASAGVTELQRSCSESSPNPRPPPTLADEIRACALQVLAAGPASRWHLLPQASQAKGNGPGDRTHHLEAGISSPVTVPAGTVLDRRISSSRLSRSATSLRP